MVRRQAAYAVELGAVRSALEAAGNDKAEDGAQRAEVELKLASVEQRLREVCNELQAKELALEVLQQRMDAEAKRTQQVCEHLCLYDVRVCCRAVCMVRGV